MVNSLKYPLKSVKSVSSQWLKKLSDSTLLDSTQVSPVDLQAALSAIRAKKKNKKYSSESNKLKIHKFIITKENTK